MNDYLLSNGLAILLATLPGPLICYLIFKADKYEREPVGPLVFCFLTGMALTLPAVWLEKKGFGLIGYEGGGFFSALFLAFIVIALNEELFKFGGLMTVFSRHFFNEPIDGIVYSVMITMGFATMENIAYANRFGMETVLLRIFTAVPAHLVFAIVQGYYVGMAKFAPRGKQGRLLLNGLGLAFLLHALYDLLILQQWFDWLFVLATAGLYLSLYFCGRLIREHLHNSPFRREQ